jgi:hypothetical protein
VDDDRSWPTAPLEDWPEGWTVEIQCWGECHGGPSDGKMIEFHQPIEPGPDAPLLFPHWVTEPGYWGTLGMYRPVSWKDEELRIALLEWVPKWDDAVG